MKEVHTKSCPNVCDPMDCNLPSSSVHGIFQAKKLEWVAISFSRESTQPRDQTHISCIGKWILHLLRYLGNPSVNAQHIEMLIKNSYHRDTN